MPSARPFLLGAVTGLICAIAFALPPLLHLKNISPMRVIRRDVGAAPPSQILSYGAAVAGSLGLLIWYSGSIQLTAWTLLGTLGALALFGALATLLLRGGRVVGMQAGSGLRLALASLQRRRKENTAQILIFGLAIMLLPDPVAAAHRAPGRVAQSGAGERAQSFSPSTSRPKTWKR